ncbi:unnamed protein product [Notodromas monacha]|uniref:Uncharacterized protein n=1 Tax=Notodromas monacha TaxID=399045 RepID=A0A7R9GHV7_9CRUS|nr:unnamed protein product [Notodromas monacha]CAG0921750.1 unnamed protein product [Notodromas monacha]
MFDQRLTSFLFFSFPNCRMSTERLSVQEVESSTEVLRTDLDLLLPLAAAAAASSLGDGDTELIGDLGRRQKTAPYERLTIVAAAEADETTIQFMLLMHFGCDCVRRVL